MKAIGLVLLAVVALAGCGRLGFEEQNSSPASDAARDSAPVIDAVQGAIDAMAPDAPDAAGTTCAYVSCPLGEVTCCATGVPECVDATAACAGQRYECSQGPPIVGCTVPGDDCCISCAGTGTECLNPTVEMCCG